MMTRVAIGPEILGWARERSRLPPATLKRRFPKLSEWERGEAQPTLKQVEALAKATHTPIGYFFLPKPLVEELPLPDFRTIRNAPLGRPSPDLLDTIYSCQERQAWYRDFAQSVGEEKRPFVGSVTTRARVEEVATAMRQTLRFDLDARRDCPTWTDALRLFIADADAAGVLVMCNGVVMNNNRRKLNPEEFRGFAIADAMAPLVFINGADTKSAQMFTLAHELAHLWLGQSAVSDATARVLPDQDTEVWCNQVAAEFLVPLDVLRTEVRKNAEQDAEMGRLARRFKVSTLVILRRMHDAGVVSKTAFARAYDDELTRLLSIDRGSGGNFYLTQAARAGKRFSRALIASTLEGQTLFRDAFRMLGISKIETFRELGRSLDVT
jgi:Zn-dependent peptidase ImmA (M78 family)/transcriptional regulator with XRE-family HTH domain